MRVLFIIPDFDVGGAQKQCALLFNALNDTLGVECRLIHVRDGVNKRWLGHDERVVKVRRSSLRNPMIALDLWREARDFNPQIVMSWLHPADTHVWLARRWLRPARWVMSERDSSYPANWRYRLRAGFGREADHIVANSEAGATYWQRNGVAPSRVSVIGNILQAIDCCPGVGLHERLAQRRWAYGWLGRLEPQKDPLPAVVAIQSVSHLSDPSYIAGSGSLSAQVSKAATGPHCSYLGYIDDATAILRDTRVFVTLSLHEGTPNALTEAVASGCVVVASDIAQHRDLLGADYPLLLPPRSSVAQIASALRSAGVIAAAPDQVRSVMLRAVERVRLMAAPTVAAQYLQLFESLSDAKN